MRTSTPKRRFALACLAGSGLSVLVFAWFLWSAPTGFMEEPHWGLGRFYDEQARALFHGRWYGSPRSFFIERITVDGRHYMYFGPWPSVLRMPVLLLTDDLDGRLTRASLLLAYGVFMGGVSRLLWQVRSIRGRGEPGRRELIGVVGYLLAIGCGTPIIFLSASAWVYDEAILWGAGWGIWSIHFALAHLLDRGRLSLVLASLTTTLAITSRVTFGMLGVLVLGMFAAALVFATRRHERSRKVGLRLAGLLGIDAHTDAPRPWLIGAAAVLPVTVYSSINWAKFGSLFAVPFHQQDIVNKADPRRLDVLAANGNDLLSFDEVPTNLINYFRPDGITLHRLFPFVDFSDGIVVVGQPTRDVEGVYSSISVTTTLVLVLALFGLVTLAVPRLAAKWNLERLRVLRVPAIACCVMVGPTLMFPSVFQRYAVDFIPALILLSMVGLYASTAAIGSNVGRRRGVLGIAALVLMWNVGANTALTLQQQRTHIGVTAADRGAYLLDRIEWTERIGIEPRGSFVAWRSSDGALPPAGPVGSFLAVDDCAALRISDGIGWQELEIADAPSVCEALGRRGQGVRGGEREGT